MALIDVVKFEGNDGEFVWKFPSENLRWGTQLVVKPAQVAVFVKGGKILDEVSEGTTTLRSNNIPLLTTLMSLPFGGDTPFQAEVWFVNLISKLNARWGTSTPLQLEDPKYGLVVPVRAYGQFGFRILEPRKFLETIVGTAKVFTADQIVDYFRGKVMSSAGSLIGKALIKDSISVVQVSAYLEELSKFCEERIRDEFREFGIEVLNFFFESINLPENDPSVVKLKQIKEKAAELNVVGRDVYQLDKSMDVLKTAGGNPGTAGATMGAGMGLGLGLAVGNALGGQAGNLGSQMRTSLPPIPPSTPSLVVFHVLVENKSTGPHDIPGLKQMISAGQLTRETLVWKDGLDNWVPAVSQSELKSLFQSTPPPPPSSPPTPIHLA